MVSKKSDKVALDNMSKKTKSSDILEGNSLERHLMEANGNYPNQISNHLNMINQTKAIN